MNSSEKAISPILLPHLPANLNRGSENQGEPNKTLLAIGSDRFFQKKQAVLRFLHDFAVPFDNNQAERDLRMSHPCSKKSQDASERSWELLCSVAFVVTSQPYESKALHSSLPSNIHCQ